MMTVTEFNPIPTPLQISPEAWRACSPDVQTEVTRAWQELSAGIAIQKDRRCGREKPHRRANGDMGISFHALHCLDMEIWRRPQDVAKIAKAEVLRRALAPDVERIEQDIAEEAQRIEDNRYIHETYGPMAKKAGLTLEEWIRRFVSIEVSLRTKPIKGFVQICKLIGVDPHEWAAAELAKGAA
jgi:hypothetical protein